MLSFKIFFVDPFKCKSFDLWPIFYDAFSVCFLYFNTAKNISRVIINGFLRFSASLIFFIPHQQIWDHEIDDYEVSYFSQYSENLQERYRLVFANSALKLMLRQVKMHPSDLWPSKLLCVRIGFTRIFFSYPCNNLCGISMRVFFSRESTEVSKLGSESREVKKCHRCSINELLKCQRSSRMIKLLIYYHDNFAQFFLPLVFQLCWKLAIVDE